MKNKLTRIMSCAMSAVVLCTCAATQASAGFDFVTRSAPTNREELEDFKNYVAAFPEDEGYDEFEIVFRESNLSEEQIAECEEFILANDRAGLYKYLTDFYYVYYGYAAAEQSGTHKIYNIRYDFLKFYTTGFTGNYITDDDESFLMTLYYYVFPHYEYMVALGASSPESGDVNLDGKVSISDIIMAEKMCIGSVVPSNVDQAKAADVDGTYVIDRNDLTYMVQYMLDITDSLGN